MLTFTIALGARDADRPDLSAEEAVAMAGLGFRFSEFRHETGRYRLSPAYKTWHNLDRGTLTFLQDESARSVRESKPTPAAAGAAGADPTELAPSAGTVAAR